MKGRLDKSLQKINPKPKIVDKYHFLFTSECLPVLKQIPSNSINLIVTDPPYNIHLKYNSYDDNKKIETYYADLKLVLIEMHRILAEDGSLYLINYPEMNARTLPMLEDEMGFKFKRWLTWHYPTNIGHSKSNYTRSQRSILFMTKTDKYIFNKPIQPYKNPDVQKIKTLIALGKKGRGAYDELYFDDLIEIFSKKEVKEDIKNDVIHFNLLKNVCKDRAIDTRNISDDEKIKHPCQLPLSLLKLFIMTSSKKGDWVLDAYAGTFTTSKASKDLGRKSIGIEIDTTYTQWGMRRLKE